VIRRLWKNPLPDRQGGSAHDRPSAPASKCEASCASARKKPRLSRGFKVIIFQREPGPVRVGRLTMRAFAAPVTRFFGRSTNRPVMSRDARASSTDGCKCPCCRWHAEWRNRGGRRSRLNVRFARLSRHLPFPRIAIAARTGPSLGFWSHIEGRLRLRLTPPPYEREAEHYARLYKAHNPRLRFRYRPVDDEGEPLNDSANR
jgi:hypothetical protein